MEGLDAVATEPNRLLEDMNAFGPTGFGGTRVLGGSGEPSLPRCQLLKFRVLSSPSLIVKTARCLRATSVFVYGSLVHVAYLLDVLLLGPWFGLCASIVENGACGRSEVCRRHTNPEAVMGL